ncbi:MAG: metal ABC transporter permease, partial [Thiohalobacteraceae bacterium]
QILWVGLDELWPVALLYAAVLAYWWLRRARLSTVGFYLLFAVCVTASVQLVGVYLVFASLIVPALATYPQRGSMQLCRGYALGALGYALGLVLSALYDLPSAAVIVWMLASVSLVFVLTKRRMH